MKESVRDPGLFVESNAPESGREMKVYIAFEFPVESMDGEEDPRCKVLWFSHLFDDIRSDEGSFLKEVSVEPEQVPEFGGHGEGNMLVVGFGEGVEFIGGPLIGIFFYHKVSRVWICRSEELSE